MHPDSSRLDRIVASYRDMWVFAAFPILWAGIADFRYEWLSFTKMYEDAPLWDPYRFTFHTYLLNAPAVFVGLLGGAVLLRAYGTRPGLSASAACAILVAALALASMLPALPGLDSSYRASPLWRESSVVLPVPARVVALRKLFQLGIPLWFALQGARAEAGMATASGTGAGSLDLRRFLARYLAAAIVVHLLFYFPIPGLEPALPRLENHLHHDPGLPLPLFHLRQSLMGSLFWIGLLSTSSLRPGIERALGLSMLPGWRIAGWSLAATSLCFFAAVGHSERRLVRWTADEVAELRAPAGLVNSVPAFARALSGYGELHITNMEGADFEVETVRGSLQIQADLGFDPQMANDCGATTATRIGSGNPIHWEKTLAEIRPWRDAFELLFGGDLVAFRLVDPWLWRRRSSPGPMSRMRDAIEAAGLAARHAVAAGEDPRALEYLDRLHRLGDRIVKGAEVAGSPFYLVLSLIPRRHASAFARDWLAARRDEPDALARLAEALERVGPDARKSFDFRIWTARSPWTFPIVPYAEAMLDDSHAEWVRRCDIEIANHDRIAIAVALERARITRGGYPDALEELVPEFLRAVPVHPSTGEPYPYRRTRDGGADDAENESPGSRETYELGSPIPEPPSDPSRRVGSAGRNCALPVS